jgi:hypothetical protein
MTDTSRLTDDQCAPYHRASEYLNEATCHLQETLSYADTLITVLYEAAALVDHLREEGSSSQADIAAVVKAVEWLSYSCADALVQAPTSCRRGFPAQ